MSKTCNNTAFSPIAKLHAPALPKILRRPRLLAMLEGSKNVKIIWVHSPPGYGKTTLLADYASTNNTTNFWYQIHKEDKSPAHFFRFLRILFLQYIALGTKDFPNLDANQWDIDSYAREFFTQIFGNIPHSFTITLDDYHVIKPDSLLHSVISVLVDCIPMNCQLLVSSREPPPDILEKFYTKQILLYIDCHNLRFKDDEVNQFLQLKGIGRDALPQEIQRVNGWITGLILFLNSVEFRSDKAILTSCEDIHINVFRYFKSEMLLTHNKNDVQLLAIASIFTYFSAEMVAVLAGVKATTAIIYFEYLYNSNYFVEKRDKHYRFHPLFRDFATDLLNQSGLTCVLSLYRRAAFLLMNGGDSDEVSRLLILSKSWSELEVLCKQECQNMLKSGRNKELLAWIECIPVLTGDMSPDLKFCKGAALIPFDHMESRALLGEVFLYFSCLKSIDKAYLAWSALIDTYFTLSDDFSSAATWIDELKNLQNNTSGFIDINVEALVLTKLIRILYWCPEKLHLFPELCNKAEKVLLKTENISTQVNLASALLKLVIVTCEYFRVKNLFEIFRQPLDSEILSPVDLVHFRYARVVGLFIDGKRAKDEMELLGLAICNLRKYGMSYMDIPSQDLFIYEANVLGRADEAEQLLQLYNTETSRSYMTNLYYIYLMQSWIHYTRKSYDEARSHLNLCVNEMLATHNSYVYLPYYFLALVDADSDNPRGAKESIQKLDQLFLLSGLGLIKIMSLVAKAYLCIKKDNNGDAAVYISELFEFFRNNLVYDFVFRINHVMSAICSVAINLKIESHFVKKLINFQLTPEVEQGFPNLHWPKAVEICILGNTLIKRNGKPLSNSAKPQKKVYLFLKYLICKEGRPVPIESVCLALWDDDNAFENFKTTLSRLRKIIGRSAVKLKNGKVCLDCALVWVDAWSLTKVCHYLAQNISHLDDKIIDENYREICLMYEGDFEIASENESLLMPYRQTLRTTLFEFLIAYCRRKKEENKISESLAICDYALNIDDMYEPAVQARITLLKLLGRNSEAIRSYKLFQQRIAKSYSITPSKETHRLIADILECPG